MLLILISGAVDCNSNLWCVQHCNKNANEFCKKLRFLLQVTHSFFTCFASNRQQFLEKQRRKKKTTGTCMYAADVNILIDSNMSIAETEKKVVVNKLL